MPKPQWLKDKEAGAQKIRKEPNFCHACLYYGPIVKFTKHKGKERVEVHVCDIHPNCFNTKYSICCDDFTSA